MKDKRKAKKIVLIVVILIFVAIALFLSNTVIILNQNPAIGRYVYGGKDITVEFSAEDTELIKDIINGKKTSTMEPICGFDEDISVKIGSQTFCIAHDSCGVLCINDGDKFIYLSEEENDIIRGMLENYGFEFPCI